MHRKKLVLLSTHIVSDLEAIAHKVFLMKAGRFQTQGTVSELLQQANGRVWELTVPAREADSWQARMAVTNLRYDGNSVTLRILADTRPDPAARTMYAHTGRSVSIVLSRGGRRRKPMSLFWQEHKKLWRAPG